MKAANAFPDIVFDPTISYFHGQIPATEALRIAVELIAPDDVDFCGRTLFSKRSDQMNKQDGKKQVVSSAMAEKPSSGNVRLQLRLAFSDMDDAQALEFFREFYEVKAKLEGKTLEDAIYPIEFLRVMQDTIFHALQDCLEAMHAPKEAIELLNDMSMLNTSMSEMDQGGGKVGWHVNSFLLDTVSSASRNIAVLGGAFYGPYGEMRRREILSV